MGFRFVSMVLIASVCAAQTPTPSSPDSASRDPADTITVPQGTNIALTLVNPIKSKTTKPGDTVRAVVAFPVAVGTKLAIPVGTYVQGIVNVVSPHSSHGRRPGVKIHFTALLFANGYSVPFEATNADAMMLDPYVGVEPIGEVADARDGAPYLGEGFAATRPQTIPVDPVPPPLPQVGSSKAAVIGASVGAMGGGTAIMLALAHHHANSMDFVLFDNGWQFSMVVDRPLTLDASQVAAATVLPARQ